MANQLVKYVKDWNRAQSPRGGVKVMPLEFGGDVYGIEVRFPSGAYQCRREQFTDMAVAISRRSGGSLQVASTYQDIAFGVFSANVSCCDEGYADSYVVSALKEFLTETLPQMHL